MTSRHVGCNISRRYILNKNFTSSTEFIECNISICTVTPAPRVVYRLYNTHPILNIFFASVAIPQNEQQQCDNCQAFINKNLPVDSIFFLQVG